MLEGIMEGNKDTIIRALALLSALRKNVDQPSITEYNSIKDSYVEEYHDALHLLEDTGMNVSHFRIPDSELQPLPDYYAYSKVKYVRKSYFLSKLDAILMYFELQTSEPKKTIGFSPPDKRKND
jgi:hypothetical protein